MKNPKNIVTLLIPITSILIIVGFVLFSKPDITGLTTYEQNEDYKIIDGDVILKTYSNEILPEHSIVKVWVDDRFANMTAKEFIIKSGKEFERMEGELTRINYKGFGYTGNKTYKLNVTDFDINTTVRKGEHKIVTEIIHGDLVLFRNEKVIVID